jgi:hypothetical protein
MSAKFTPLVSQPLPFTRRTFMIGALASLGFTPAHASLFGKKKAAEVWPVNVNLKQPLLNIPQLSGLEKLRVAYVRNSNLPDIPSEMIVRVLRRAEVLCTQLLDVKVQLLAPQELSLARLFGGFSASLFKLLRDETVPFKTSELYEGQRESQARALEADLVATGQPASALFAYAKPYLITSPDSSSLRSLAYALVETHWQRLKVATGAKTLAGDALLGDDVFNEYMFWSNMDELRLPFEVLLTNQPIVSMERSASSMHSALRGGVSNGVTAVSGAARFGTYSVLSLYPMFSADAWLAPLRAGQTYEADAAVNYAALVLVHELGHQLLHLGHPYGHQACVMSPTPALDFAAWARAIGPSCKLSKLSGMEPGAATFPRPRYPGVASK